VEQEHQHSLCKVSKPKLLLSAHKSGLNANLHPLQAQIRSEVTEAVPGKNASISQEIMAMPTTLANNTPSNFLLDRGTMEEARLARLGKSGGCHLQ
jgi:hypothetical protein